MPINNILIEAKADTQKLIDFAGEELAYRFLAIKNKLQPPRNDLYYWIKNHTPERLRKAVEYAEAIKSNRQKIRDASSGAELICETDNWKVYHITTFEASQKYGRDSQWCITGVGDYGDRYWKQYTEQGVKFYFLITKGDYDPRGYDSKFAIAVYPNGEAEMFNQQDDRAGIDEVPCPNGIKIPGIDIDDIRACIGFCEFCDTEFYYDDDICYGPNGECMCESCYENMCFFCSQCDETYWDDQHFELPDGTWVCERCFENSDVGFCDGCGDVFYFDSLHMTDDGEIYCDDCYEEESDDTEVEEGLKLTEAKADFQNLVSFAGEDLANRFMAVKSKFKHPENDLYYWIKNSTASDLEKAVSKAEVAKSNRQRKKDIYSSGGELVNETPNWKIYRIDTFEAAQYYGRDTQWCITGINDWGDKYWRQYTDDGCTFYFLITKGTYNPRGLYSKIALAIYPENTCEIYNQRDGLMLLKDIPNLSELEIPGIDLFNLDHTEHICHECNHGIKEINTFIGLDNNEYCEECFQELFCVCERCEDTFKIDDCDFTASGHWMCYDCIEEAGEEIMESFMSNWVDASGNRVSLNSLNKSNNTSTVTSRTYTDRFYDIIDYHKQHLQPNVTNFVIDDVVEDATNAIFYITETHQIGKTFHERKVLAAVSKNKGQPEPWVVVVYKDKNLDYNNQGYGYTTLLDTLSKVMQLPGTGTAEFDKLLEYSVNTFAEDFECYDTLWN